MTAAAHDIHPSIYPPTHRSHRLTDPMLTETDDRMLENFHTYDGDKRALFAAIAYKADVITFRELQAYISAETDASGSPSAINDLIQDLVDLCK